MSTKVKEESRLDELMQRFVTDKTSPEETERIELFLCVMKDLGMLRIEQEYEDSLFVLLSDPNFNRRDVEFFVYACGSESFSEGDALEVIREWRAQM